MQRRYWKFYWPLAVMSVAMLLGRQFQNRVLASYPDAKRELVVFALAFSTFALFRAAIVFVPQMTNVLVRSRRSHGLVLMFTCAVCGVLTVPVALLALTPPGERLLQSVFRIDESALAPVVRYMRFFTPLVFIGGFTQFYTGLLVQAKRTGIVTLLQMLKLVSVTVILVAGWELGWGPVLTLSLSVLLPACVHLVLSFILHLSVCDPPGEPEPETLRLRETIAFFWPVALTSVMFSFSRPILYSFLARVPDGEATIAAVAVAFSLAIIFHSPVNRFRDLFVTFGLRDLEGVRRFMLRIMAATAGLMLLATATPVVRVCLRGVLNVRGEVLRMAAETFWPLCMIPLVVTLRNYYHGLAMVDRRTGGMGAGGVARNLAIFTTGLVLFKTGRLNHVTAACVLVLGFLAEALVVLAFTRFRRAGDASPSAEGPLTRSRT